MLFNSFEFIFAFLPIVFFSYFLLNKLDSKYISKIFLVIASLFFYSWWNVSYLPIILISMVFNYLIGKNLYSSLPAKSNKNNFKKVLLIIGIVLNLSLLGYFKYSDFFLENINLVLNTQIELLNLTLPLAISFFTFQQIAYLVDSYKHETKEYDFLNYALFVSFFPQLIAGPIVHHKEMMPQFEEFNNKHLNYRNITLGLFIFSIGLFKKVAIADTFAIWATQGFDQATVLYFYEAWATSLSYSFQLYFDFSGYTDMAIGLALLFNIKLPVNFNSPYKAINIQDFWRRWHMTLSRFLRDYIYIPLGGNRKGKIITYFNLMATFILGGIWHGAGWTFVLWGTLHGLALVVHRAWCKLNIHLWTGISWIITFLFVNFAWVFFRATNWDSAIKVLKGMFGMQDKETFYLSIGFLDSISRIIDYPLYKEVPFTLTNSVNEGSLLACIIALFIVLKYKNSTEFLNDNPTVKMTITASVLFSMAIIFSSYKSVEIFLYFNF